MFPSSWIITVIIIIIIVVIEYLFKRGHVSVPDFKLWKYTG